MRDVGALFLALIVVTAWAAWKRQAAAAAAWLVQGGLHFTYHVGHLDELGVADKVALVGSLVSVPILAALALWTGTSRVEAW